jgi:8-oxo-dGTP pyrophosphatase MutT (NUDIX family)
MNLFGLFRRSRVLRQTGALPYILTKDGLEVMLVTSRRRKRWIIPKGWPVNGLSLAEAAAKEAEEEAGVLGALGDDAVGAYAYEKLTDRGYPAPCEVLVFPLNATFQLLDWKERGQRSIRWLPIAEAADIAADRPLARLLTELAAAPARLGPPRF